jgi:hypothetical protein
LHNGFEKLDRRRVEPLCILDHGKDRLLPGEALELGRQGL